MIITSIVCFCTLCQRSLPQLEKQIKEKLEKTSTELRMLGDGVPQDETERDNFLIEVN